MDYLTLAPGLPPSSRLGFGCGGVMGRVGRTQSLRAIAAALDGGITHFDVARLYGYGEAEALVGEALAGKRDRVVVASKFGLTATRAAGALRALKPIAQKLAASVPGARSVMRSLVGVAAQPADRFSLAAAQASLDQSLMALKTDYLDILFLHDCAAGDLSDELAAFLDAQVAAGKIRAWGVASDIAAVGPLHAQHGDRLLYQFPNSIAAPNVRALPADARCFICHSPFADSGRIAARLAGAIEPGDLHAAMLGYALTAPGVAVVLCSMLDEAHLRANLDAVAHPRFTAARLADLAALVGKPIAHAPAA
ncbi:MAG TPA: aldo/keto reductase [Stellaceae bacterium]|nr:aldo/keto reductase [Stellaceae bacterium]